MSLFSQTEVVKIKDRLEKAKHHILITFKQEFVPTRLNREWYKLLKVLGYEQECISWWSSSGNMGLLECEGNSGKNIYGQWVLDDSTRLVEIFDVTNEDLVSIRDGYDSGNVVSSEMRAIRIGETGGELE